MQLTLGKYITQPVKAEMRKQEKQYVSIQNAVNIIQYALKKELKASVRIYLKSVESFCCTMI